MNILGIGEVVIDHYEMQTDAGSQTDPSKHIGGPVVAALVVLSRLGLPCKFITSLGPDDHAQFIRTALHAENIELIEKPRSATKVNRIIVDAHDGQRTKLRHPPTYEAMKAVDPSLIHEADLIIIDRHEPHAFRQIMASKRPSTKVIIDPSTEISDHTRHMIATADFPIVPIEACAALSPGDDLVSGLHALHALNSGPVVVTAGELGSILFDGVAVELAPGLDLRALDTNGAGDVFRGGFAYGLAQGWSLSRCARFANYLGGLQCLAVGNLDAIPSRGAMLAHRHHQHSTRSVSLSQLGARFRELRQSHRATVAQTLKPSANLV